MKNPSHTDNYSNQKLNHFLSKIINEKQMAQTLRRSAYLIALAFIRSDENINPMSPEWTDNSFYFLNELAECLDPILEDE
ncbi:hypothetical protein [Flavobacterium psychrophilum]|uniref:hypothetical protein n=1 Tax=Flavobacterium psychrophilum TaxID=96345 RepID=UPI0010699498|nr:hypothetical protein [Flavobacterium psychrophilum]MBF2093078.1 hypothetical protein [Flavobacterium psychrophilum]